MKKLLSAWISAGLVLCMAPSALAAEAVAGMTDRTMAEDYVRNAGIMLNEADNSFHADYQVSRVDFVVSAVDHFYAEDDFDDCFRDIAPKLPPRYSHLFSDVHKDVWYAGHLCVGMFAGLLNGNKDGSFLPHKGITAAEASKILSKAYGLTYPSQKPNAHPWYESAMHAMRLHGALPEGMKPSHILTRGDVAQMFYALRNTRRFPLERVIGQTQPAPSAAVPTSPANEPAAVAAAIEVRARGDRNQHSVTAPIPTDVMMAAQTRRAPKISRRTLLQQVHEERMKN